MPVALWTVALAIFAGWLTLAAVHVADDYRVSHVQGVWVAAAEAVRSGRLYPPLVDGEYYSGTRYMPLPILLNAAASAIADDPIIGGKMIAAILMAVLLATVVVVLKRSSCPLPLACGLAAVVVATDTGLQAATTIGGTCCRSCCKSGPLRWRCAVAPHVNSRWRARSPASLSPASSVSGGAVAVITWLAMNPMAARYGVCYGLPLPQRL
jgi:hypothetical protein